MTTAAPSSASLLAMAKPMLEEINRDERGKSDGVCFSYSYPSVEAVTTATFPAKRFIGLACEL